MTCIKKSNEEIITDSNTNLLTEKGVNVSHDRNDSLTQEVYNNFTTIDGCFIKWTDQHIACTNVKSERNMNDGDLFTLVTHSEGLNHLGMSLVLHMIHIKS